MICLEAVKTLFVTSVIRRISCRRLALLRARYAYFRIWGLCSRLDLIHVHPRGAQSSDLIPHAVRHGLDELQEKGREGADRLAVRQSGGQNRAFKAELTGRKIAQCLAPGFYQGRTESPR